MDVDFRPRRVRGRSRICSVVVTVFALLTTFLVPAAWMPAAEASSRAQPQTYTNPVVSGLTANPFVLKSGSKYYAYVNGFDYYLPFPVMALSSTDLVNWTQVGNVLPADKAGAWADATSGRKFSSPAVRHIPGNPAGSRYVLYFTGTEKGTGKKCIGVARSSSPEGPFTGAAEPLLCPAAGAQDPSPVPLPDNAGIQEIVYVSNGRIYNHILEQNGLTLRGDPIFLYKANPDWWHEGTVERPTVINTSSGAIYLFFSGRPANTAGRAIGWTTCTQGFGVVNNCTRQTHFGTWIAGNDKVDSPSGPQVFSDGASHWLAYDGLPAGSCPETGACRGTRSMRIDKLCFTDKGLGMPRTNAPTGTAQLLDRKPGCSADIPGRPFEIVPGSVSDDRTVRQAPKIAFRDGGATAPIAGRAIWAFSDTITRSGCRARTNTGGLGAPAPGATGPNWTVDPVDENGCPPQLIPFTAEEREYNETNPDRFRIALWEAGMIPLPGGDVAIVFMKLIVKDCSLCYEFVGMGVARFREADVAAGRLTAIRSPSVAPRACNPRCLFAAADGDLSFMRPVIHNGYVYMYHQAKLTRARVSDLQDRAKYRFWTGEPAPAAWSAEPSDAADVPGLFEGGWDRSVGQVTYNPYVDRFVNIGPDNWPETNKIIWQTAGAPWGPFTPERPLHNANVHKCENGGTPYGALQPQEFMMDGGRTMPFTYARPGPNLGLDPACPGQVRYVTFKIK